MENGNYCIANLPGVFMERFSLFGIENICHIPISIFDLAAPINGK
jgi:hypothetical protein